MNANLGPVLLIKEFDPTNKVYAALAGLNLLTLWYVAVLAVGLSKIGRVSFLKAALWLFGAWALIKVISLSLFP